MVSVLMMTAKLGIMDPAKLKSLSKKSYDFRYFFHIAISKVLSCYTIQIIDVVM